MQIARYRGRLSGPLRDRIDLIVDVPPVPVSAITDGAGGESSAAVRERVRAARTIQQGAMAPMARAPTRRCVAGAVAGLCRPDPAGRALLRKAIERLGLSARGYDRVLKVGRTIADLAGSPGVTAEHVAEALQYRLVE